MHSILGKRGANVLIHGRIKKINHGLMLTWAAKQPQVKLFTSGSHIMPKHLTSSNFVESCCFACTGNWGRDLLWLSDYNMHLMYLSIIHGHQIVFSPRRGWTVISYIQAGICTAVLTDYDVCTVVIVFDSQLINHNRHIYCTHIVNWDSSLRRYTALSCSHFSVCNR